MTDNLKAHRNQKDRRALYNGFGDTLARGIELVLTPAIFAVIGFVLDGWIGIRPVLTIGFALFALAGMGVRMYYGYEQAMKAEEARLPGKRRHA